LLQDISGALTTVARTERLLARESESRQAAESLLNATQVIGGTLYADIALDRIVEQMHDVMHSECCNIMLLSENRAQVVRWRGYDTFDVPIHGLALEINDHPVLMQMLLDGQPVSIDDMARDPGRLNWYGQQQLRSYVGAPILAQNIVIGFLNIEGTRIAQFPSPAAERLKILADTAGAALQNAGLYRQLHNYAERLEEQIHERTAQLQALYAQLETVLDIASDGIVVIDSNGEILRTNAAAEQWLGSKVALDEAVRLRQVLRELVQRVHERPRELLDFENVQLLVQAVPLPQSIGPQEAAVIGLHAEEGPATADEKTGRSADHRLGHS